MFSITHCSNFYRFLRDLRGRNSSLYFYGNITEKFLLWTVLSENKGTAKFIDKAQIHFFISA